MKFHFNLNTMNMYLGFHDGNSVYSICSVNYICGRNHTVLDFNNK